MTLGEVIKAYRAEHGMSMDDFSKASGISKAYISVLEKNKRPGSGLPVQPSIKCVRLAAKAMGIDFTKLILTITPQSRVESIRKGGIEIFIWKEEKELIDTILGLDCVLSDYRHNRLPEQEGIWQQMRLEALTTAIRELAKQLPEDIRSEVCSLCNNKIARDAISAI